MYRKARIGFQNIPDNPFLVEIALIIEQQARYLEITLIPVDIGATDQPGIDYENIIEELLAQDIDAFILIEVPEPLLELLRQHAIPIISLSCKVGCHTGTCQHPGIISPLGMYDIGRIGSEYLIEQLHGCGEVLIIGGLKGVGEDGRSFLEGVYSTFAPFTAIRTRHIPTAWRYDAALPQILAGMQQLDAPPAAILGLSDTLALAGREAALQLGLLKSDSNMLVVGHNGDPEALTAIVKGQMAATVDNSTTDFVYQVIELALQAAAKSSLPAHYHYKPNLVTRANVTEAAIQKLMAIAELPNLLVGVNRRSEQQQLNQLKATLSINSQISAILDRKELIERILNLLRTNFNYSQVNLYFWPEIQTLLEAEAANIQTGSKRTGVFSQVLASRELVFVPNMQSSQRFMADPNWPDTRSRVVLPISFDNSIFCLLDLQADKIVQHSREQLLGLQVLADHLGIAIRNAELYNEALEARKEAEKADKLKTLLLANVSHEFRTPLNIILGYAKEALKIPNPYASELPPELREDINRISRSGEHLLRLINDLLDLSRAEINELEIFPEVLDIRPILEEVFYSLADISSKRKAVKWIFDVPATLPLMQVDPIRLRQIILNLLSNAHKFTQQGQITLGVDIKLPSLHLWVKDSGSGIAPDQQPTIFDPFMVGGNPELQAEGIGLGLSITRHLVTLHRGYINFESLPGSGSTFNVYLPLPNLSGKLLASLPVRQQTLVYISNSVELPPEIVHLSQYNQADLHKLKPAEVSTRLLTLEPSIIALDAASISEDEWSAVDLLRSEPHLARLPLILYNSNDSQGEQNGLTNILLKPLSGQTLSNILATFITNHNRGEILIVDDEDETLNLYQSLIQSALPGFTVHRANTGQAALALLKQMLPSLVIIDLVMPGISGYEIIKWLRSNPATQKVPILVASGQPITPEFIQYLDYPRIIFQPKEILQTEEVSTTLREILGGTPLLSQYKSILVKRTVMFVQQNYSRPISLNEIAQSLGASKTKLSEIFRTEMRLSIWEYLTRYRIKEAKRWLQTSDLDIAVIAARVGFEDPAYFSRVFHTLTGQSPTAFRKGATGHEA